MKNQETEAKFYVRNLQRIEKRLQELGARLIQPRTFERNLRFDRPDSSLRNENKVLRLRQDEAVRLTFKGPGTRDKGVLSRQELEFTASDFKTAQAFLEALGYRVVATYEKFRSTYTMETLHIMLDELPYGNFVEIEGATTEEIRQAAGELGLDFEAAIPMSYLALFDQLCMEQGLDAATLTFDYLGNVSAEKKKLNLKPAD